ncbi:uroporphyrinogen-III C-methyltransferase [Acidocella sp.]|uniref:uroporphyrinogen-III C-methyltransferase n=1 Tax=Acidocella sp. TaxID=50710 RepID=UPI00260ACB3C|nr:uroporphyrinogen-III C-methyltransferase [Acidocella sp.]
MAKTFLIGAGPGDPDLLTLRAARLLGQAEIVLHDALVGEGILQLANPAAELVDVGKRFAGKAMAQAEICRKLVAAARTGKLVVRLKGGDPMIFGRATEEMEALTAAGFEFEVVPGVTAACAAAAGARMSLTRRGVARSLHFLTGHGAEGGLPAHDWGALVRAGGTIAVYMGGHTLAGLAAHLIEAGMAPGLPALAVENAGRAEAREIAGTLATLPRRLREAKPLGPVLLLLGEALGPETVRAATREAMMTE